MTYKATGREYGMTRRMRDCLEFIHDYSGRNGYAPSYDEIMDALGLRSKSGVHRIVHALEERMFITLLPDRARSIEVIIPPAQRANRLFEAWRAASKSERDDLLYLIGAKVGEAA